MGKEEEKPGIDYCCGARDSESGCCPFEEELSDKINDIHSTNNE